MEKIHLLSYRICIPSIEIKACENESEITSKNLMLFWNEISRFWTLIWALFVIHADLWLSKMSFYFIMLNICKSSKMSRRRQNPHIFIDISMAFSISHRNKSLSMNDAKTSISNERPWTGRSVQFHFLFLDKVTFGLRRCCLMRRKWRVLIWHLKLYFFGLYFYLYNRIESISLLIKQFGWNTFILVDCQRRKWAQCKINESFIVCWSSH